MGHELTVSLGGTQLNVVLARRTVVLCDNSDAVSRMVRALMSAGAALVEIPDSSRAQVSDLLPKRTTMDDAMRMVHQLHLSEDIMGWRLRSLSGLQRMIAGSVLTLLEGRDLLVIDIARAASSPFEQARAFAHMRRMAHIPGITLVVVISDPALISSAGDHLIAMDGDAVAEVGPVRELLAEPRSDALRIRLESTPVANPLAMQMRRVRYATTRPVDFSQTTIVQLPAPDSIALVGGDDTGSLPRIEVPIPPDVGHDTIAIPIPSDS